MMRRGLLLSIALLTSGCATTATTAGDSAESPAAETPLPAVDSAGDPLYPAAEGAWQIYYLPPEWIEANLPAPQPVLAYVALVAAHPEDVLNNTGMCPAPQRIVLGRVAPDASIRERTFACLDVCGEGEDDGSLYRGLWASGTHLEGTTARVLEDGSVTVFEHYREVAFMTPEVAENPAVVDKLRFEGAAKILERSIVPSAFEFSEGEAKPCHALEQGL